MPKTLSLLAVLKKIDAKGIKSLSDPQWNTFLASDTEPNEIKEKIAKLEGYEQQGAAYDKTGELIVEDNNAMIERFRQRTGRAKGRESLKVKKSKINVKSFKENFLDKDEESVKPDTTGTSTLTNFQPPAPNPDLSLPDAEEEKEETEGLKGIRDVLDDILKVLRLDFKGDRKEARDAQKEAAKDKREERERKLEGGGLKKTLGGIGATLKGIEPIGKAWDAIINFLKFTLIGVLFNKTMKWFSDPKNQQKAKRIGKFFKDWWPALATAAALFLTPLGGLIKGVVGLLTAIIPKLVMAIAANPWAAAALVGTGLAVWGVSKLASGLGGDKEGENLAEAQNQSSEQLQEEGMDAGDAEVLSQSVTTENVDRMTQGDTNLRSNTNMLQTGRDDPLGGNNMGRFNEGGLVQSTQSSNVQNYNEGGLVQSSSTQSNQSSNVQNFNEGGLVQSSSTQSNQSSNVQNFNEGGLVNTYNDVHSAQNFVQKYNQGGLVQHLNEGGKMSDELGHTRGTVTDPKEKARIEAETLKWVNKERVEFLGLPPLDKITYAEGVELTKAMGPEYYGKGIIETSDTQSNFDTMTKTTWKTKSRGAETIFQGSVGQLTEEDKQNYLASKPNARLAQALNQQIELDNLGADISASAKMNGGGPVTGFNRGGKVPGSGNKDTVPAMLTPGEFVMSKGAVNKYGVDTLENMNAAAGSVGPGGRAGPAGPAGPKGDTVPSMLTPGEFVVSVPAVQKYGVKTLESMNLKGGGNNKPEVKVGANKGGLINNYNTTLMKYKGGGVVEESVEESIEENVSRDIVEIIKKTSEHFISLVESSGFEANNISTSDKTIEPVGTPAITSTTKTITLPTIPKQGDGELIPAKSKNEIPEFRIPIVSSHRSMVIASLGIQDLVGG